MKLRIKQPIDKLNILKLGIEKLTGKNIEFPKTGSEVIQIYGGFDKTFDGIMPLALIPHSPLYIMNTNSSICFCMFVCQIIPQLKQFISQEKIDTVVKPAFNNYVTKLGFPKEMFMKNKLDTTNILSNITLSKLLDSPNASKPVQFRLYKCMKPVENDYIDITDDMKYLIFDTNSSIATIQFSYSAYTKKLFDEYYKWLKADLKPATSKEYF